MRFFKLVLLSRRSCREVQLSPETEDQVRIGTEHGCAVRFRREYFFGDFSLELRRSGDGWMLRCPGQIYVTRDGVLKLHSLELTHGLNFQVFSASEQPDSPDIELFKGSFLLDFEQMDHTYLREIDLNGLSRLSIGGKGEHIRLRDELVGEDTITLERVDGGWSLSDPGTRYGVAYNSTLISEPVCLRDYDFFSLVGHSFFLKGDKLYTDPTSACETQLPWRDLPETDNQFRYPGFNRSTRLQVKVPEVEIEVLPPAPKKEERRKSLLFSLIPSLTMLILIVVLRGVIGGGGMFVIYSACSMGIGIIMSIATYISDRRQAKKDEEKRQADYNRYVAGKRAQVTELRALELETLQTIYTDWEEELRQAEAFNLRLFERAPQDPDYLRAYLGKGRIEAPNQLKVTPQEFKNGDDPLTELPEQLAEEYRYLEQGPVTACLRDDNCLGVVGSPPLLAAALRGLSFDLAARHYFKDVKLVYLLGDGLAGAFLDLRWLPHVQTEEGLYRYLGCDRESREMILESLYTALSAREAERERDDGETPVPSPAYVVFVYGVQSLANHPISQYFEYASALGFTFLFFSEYQEMLPRGCGEILFLRGENQNDLVVTENSAGRLIFQVPRLEESRLLRAVMKLAATQVEDISLEAGLTQSISFYELLGIVAAEDLDLEQRWAASRVYQSIAAPLGVNWKNETVSLDIGDKSSAHGPHGLVAGTTGSGKSELLQSYILSIATLFHPYDVSFVIIDFKGGGMANQFRALPHLLGTITNIDGREIDRSLLSIKAELLRRQAIFAEAGVNHINDYIKLFKGGEVQVPLPHLIMIVDEFAELKSEFPDFMKELISAARIGRTLGIHLILATQKPSGVVDAQIWSNSRFRLCLKVQNREDSQEVLKSPLAAEIKEPGRAYFQVGNNEIFELFQSAYSGAPVPDIESAKSKTCEIYECSPWGKRELIYSNQIVRGTEEEISQLQAIVDYVGGYCEEKAVAKLPGICLPPLPDTLLLSSLTQPPRKDGVTVAVGYCDDPEQQRQSAFLMDVTAENCFVAGASQMGKTTFLRTLACALIGQYSPGEVNLYFIDCGAMALKVFELASHTGGVVLATEEERMSNLFKLLFRTVEQRRKIFAEKGIGTYTAYLEAGFRDMPQIVVMLDNMAAFREYYERFVDSLLVLSREGLGAGISFVVTGTQGNALSYKAMSNFSRRVVFTCTDSGEYTSLLGHTRLSPKPTPGRALIQQEKRVLECQIALGETGAREIERVEELKAFLVRRSGTFPESLRAAPIPMVPELLLEEELLKQEPRLFQAPYQLPLGMDYGQVEYVALDLLRAGTLVFTGPDSAGRLSFLRYLLSAIRRVSISSPVEGYLFDDESRALGAEKRYGFVDIYSADPEESMAYLEELSDKLRLRRKAGPAVLEEEPLLLVVLESRRLFQSVCADRTASQLLLELIRQACESRTLLILSNVENTSPAFNAPELLKYLRDQRQGILFGGLAECRFYEVQPKQTRELSQNIRNGDCFLFQGNQLLRMKPVQQQSRKEEN